MRTPPRDPRRADGLLQLALAAAVVLLATSLVRFTVTWFGYEPTLHRLYAAQRAETGAHQAMLDMQTGVRGYQLSADDAFLVPYLTGRAAYPADVAAARTKLAELPQAQTEWATADAAALSWQRHYAAPAVEAVKPGSPPPPLNVQRLGNTKFAVYRSAEHAAAATVSNSVTSRRHGEDLFRTATGTIQTVALLLLVLVLLRRQRRPEESGRRNEGLPVSAAGAPARTEGFAVDPADPDRLAAAITEGGREISGAVSAQLWLAEVDGELRRINPGQPTITAQRRRHDVALRAHREGAITTSGGRSRRTVAVPLLHEGKTLGVVELTMPRGSGQPTHSQIELLRAWGRQTARAVSQGVAARDRLTGLGGRAALAEALTGAVARSLSLDRPVSLVMLEIDHFDRHSASGTGLHDELVRTVADVLSDTVRTTDCAYRTDDGSFAVLLTDAPGQAAVSLAERLRQIIARRFVERGVTASFGVASCPDTAEDEQGLLEAAESALYDAQHFGGNRAQPARRLSDELELARRPTEIS